MSRMSELSLCVCELRSAAESLNVVADSISAMFGDNVSEQRVAPALESTTPRVTLEQVRAVLADKSRSGKTGVVRELLGRYGVDRLSAIDPVRFPELLREAEEL